MRRLVTEAGCMRNVEILLSECRRRPVIVPAQSSNYPFSHHISAGLKHSHDTSCPTLTFTQRVG